MRWRLWLGLFVGVVGVGIYFVTAGGGAQAAPGERAPEGRSTSARGAQGVLQAAREAKGSPRLNARDFPDLARAAQRKPFTFGSPAALVAGERPAANDSPPVRSRGGEGMSAKEAAYVESTDPNRVYYTLPESSVSKRDLVRKTLKTMGPASLWVKPLSITLLKVKAPSNAWVTFVTVGGGLFENGLGSITVKAQRTGLAKASWIASRDAMGPVEIHVGSPQAVGLVTFSLNVELSPAEREGRSLKAASPEDSR